MKNEYELTLDDEIALDLLTLQREEARETAELDQLDYLDRGDYDLDR